MKTFFRKKFAISLLKQQFREVAYNHFMYSMLYPQFTLGTIQVLRHQKGGWGGQMMMFDDKVGGWGLDEFR